MKKESEIIVRIDFSIGLNTYSCDGFMTMEEYKELKSEGEEALRRIVFAKCDTKYHGRIYDIRLVGPAVD